MHWETKKFLWLTLLWSLPYYGDLELKPWYPWYVCLSTSLNFSFISHWIIHPKHSTLKTIDLIHPSCSLSSTWKPNLSLPTKSPPLPHRLPPAAPPVSPPTVTDSCRNARYPVQTWSYPLKNRGWRKVTICKYFFHSKNNSMAVHATAPRKNSDPIKLAGSYNCGQIRSLGKRIKVWAT